MKRFNDFGHGSGKKIKLSNDINDLWGDDPDEDDIDDCLILATQIYDKQSESSKRNNVSIMPTYSTFQQKQVFSSTQVHTSTAFDVKVDLKYEAQNGEGPKDVMQLADKIRRLEANYEAKVGEVSILRTQLQQTKITLEAENHRMQKDLNEQLNSTKSHMNSAVTKLELKDLEVANLKRKLLDISRNVTVDTNLNSIVIKNVATDSEDILKKDLKIEPVVHVDYPLRDVISPSMFVRLSEEQCSSPQMDCLASNRQYFRTSLYASSLFSQTNMPITKVITSNPFIKLDVIFPEIAALLKCDEYKLESDNNNINKILLTTLYHINQLWRYLKDFEASTHKDSIRRLDLVYLNEEISCDDNAHSFFDSQPWCDNEHGIQCRQLIALVSELFVRNSHLREYVIGSKPIRINYENEFSKYLNGSDFSDEIKHLMSENKFLKAILSIIEIIGKMRKTFYYCGFLSAVCLLLTKMCHSMDKISDELCKTLSVIMKEIIFSRPSALVLYHFSDALKAAAVHKTLVEYLCLKPEKNYIKRNNKKAIVLISENCCTLQVFSLLVKNNLNTDKKTDVNTYRKYLNILQFICSALYSNANWLYYQENKHYDCLFEVNKLSLQIMYAVLIKYPYKDVKMKAIECFVKDIIQISVKLLHILNFKCVEFLERDVAMYALNKSIKVTLLEACNYFNIPDNDVIALDKPSNNSIDEQHVDVTKLDSIMLWTEDTNSS